MTLVINTKDVDQSCYEAIIISLVKLCLRRSVQLPVFVQLARSEGSQSTRRRHKVHKGGVGSS